MGLFDKKYCSICGNEIKFLGNRKLSDGNMCKDCASKLSPWFSERRSSTIEEIKQQLAYRMENERALASFNPTAILGDGTKIYIDENAKKFVVTRARDFRSGNPDIISTSQVMDVAVDVRENKSEIYTKDAEGKRISYDPKKYEYSYDFTLNMAVNSPWFDEISFDLDNGEKPESREDDRYKELVYEGAKIQHALRPDKYPEPVLETEEKKEEAEDGEWICECGQKNYGNFCARCGKPKKTKWYCPKCGRENLENFCAACGTKKPDNL
ncbi:MAG: DUF4428 domain-containing protein [Solobacterium sp.]|nr:DUF4428 domain-containing protein [Solobacterium sp.]